MTNKAYYHIYLPEDRSWANIFCDQIGKMIDSGLVNDLENFHVIAIGNPDSIKELGGLLQYYHKVTGLNITLTWFQKSISDNDLVNLDNMPNKDVLSETQTLKIIRDEARNSKKPYNILYFHAKAVTSVEKCLKRGQYDRFINYIHWRKLLDHFSLIKYKDSIELLNNFDAVGCNFCEWPSFHFSGNYWWSDSVYISSLADPNDEIWWELYKKDNPDLYRLPNRLVSEMWIGSGVNSKLYSFYNHPSPPPISNLGEQIIYAKEYLL
jgi:hypothetical protein